MVCANLFLSFIHSFVFNPLPKQHQNIFPIFFSIQYWKTFLQSIWWIISYKPSIIISHQSGLWKLFSAYSTVHWNEFVSFHFKFPFLTCLFSCKSDYYGRFSSSIFTWLNTQVRNPTTEVKLTWKDILKFKVK